MVTRIISLIIPSELTYLQKNVLKKRDKYEEHFYSIATFIIVYSIM